MATNKELEKRIETLEKEVQHLKAVLQYQIRNKKSYLWLKITEKLSCQFKVVRISKKNNKNRIF